MKNAVPWRQVQRNAFTDWKKLLKFLQLEAYEGFVLKASKFPLYLPQRLAEKIEKGALHDPILKQFLPVLEEEDKDPLFLLDPVGDIAASKTPKLLHKYQGRALLVCTSACAMHCRFCFRRHYDYETVHKSFDDELKIIAEDPSLSEILLSGGDPLSLDNTTLGALLQRLEAIPHVKRIRFHTRFPIGIPERIDEGFLELLKKQSKQIFFLVHCNHVREFDAEVIERLKSIHTLGIPVLTQTVLLQGVNDDLLSLKELFEFLIDHGFLPYYLHQLDRVQGAAHFEVSQEKGSALLKELQKLLPGYALPRYVQEIPHQPSKSLIL